jgi:hypothetical protein
MAFLPPWMLALSCSPEPGGAKPPQGDDSDSSVPVVEAVDADGDGYDEDADCDDANAAVYPSAVERCNGSDDDCNSLVDDDAADVRAFYADADGDGYGDPAVSQASCEAPTGYVDNDDDCNDADAAMSFFSVWYTDADLDGFGDGVVGTGCMDSPGFTLVPGDCDDARADTYPGGPELCDRRDNDCDQETDEDPVDPLPWYVDADGDRFGDPSMIVYACDQPENTARQPWDCDDTAGNVSPMATEYCDDGIDSDCSGRDSNGCSVDTLGTSGWTWTGVDNLGRGVDAAGDVNGDGLDDALVGTWSYSSFAGIVYLLYGNTLPDAYEDISTVADASIVGTDRYDEVGTDMATAGDLNGDGYDDVHVGAANWNDDKCRSCGANRVYLGPLQGAYGTADADVVALGAVTTAGIGGAGAEGDFDNDGQDDFVFGGTGASDGPNVTFDGSLYFFSGPLTGGELDPAAADATYTGENGTSYATGVTSLKDVDGDGLNDFAVGDWRYDGDGGAVFLFQGPISGTMDAATADVTYTAEARGDRLGFRCEWAGDLDGDGSIDLAMSAYSADDAGYDDGAVYLVYGPLDTSRDMTEADATITNEGTSYHVGNGLAEGADFDGDGFDDLALGDMGDNINGTQAGAVFLFYGPVSGPREANEADLVLQGATVRYYAGTDIDVLDFDGDTAPDLLVGAMGASSNAGAAYLVPNTAL